MAIQNVALVGADGSLGPVILNALLASSRFTITVLKRASSTSKPAHPDPAVHVRRISDGFPLDEVASALKDAKIDAVVVAFRGNIELQKRLADAAAKAGVKQFVPADFGSCDSGDEIVRQYAHIYVGKTEVREHLQGLASSNEGFAWTSLVCGHFFEDLELMHVDLKEKKMEVLDDGETRASASTLKQIAAAVAKLLDKGVTHETRNRILYIQSFCVTQNQIRAAFERATGGQPWECKSVPSQPFLEQKAEVARTGDAAAMEEVVWVLGTRYANWESREGFALQILGLAEENLDEVVKEVVTKHST